MLEVEIKAKLKNRSEVLPKLEKLGCTIKKAKEQEDKIFIKKEFKNFDIPLGENVIRLRKEDDKTILTLKKKMADNKASVEIESLVDDEEAISRMLEEMGYKKLVFIKKRRKRYSLGRMSICVDNVENLGDFIEVEIMTDEDDSKKEEALKEIEEFLRKIDILEEDYENKRYDTLMYELNNK